MTINFRKIKSSFVHLCQKIGAGFAAPTKRQVHVALLFLGFLFAFGGLTSDGFAARDGFKTYYNEGPIPDTTNAVLTYFEGSLGAIVMVASGIGAILCACLRRWYLALGLAVVATAVFTLRAMMSTFFTDLPIQL